jgi:hypothetical protein
MKKLIVVLSILALVATVQADIIAQYTFTNSTQTALAGYNPDITPSIATIYSNQAGFALGLPSTVTFITGQPAGDTLGAASRTFGNWRGEAATNGFFDFSFTINAGYQLDLSSVTFYGRSTPSGAATYDMQVSTNLGVSFASIGSGAQLIDSSWQSHTANSSLPTGVTGQIEFRLYGYGASGSGSFGLDTVVVNGTVIPEPGTMALMGIGLLGLTYLRRKVG